MAGFPQISVTDDGGSGQSGTILNKANVFDPLNTGIASLNTLLTENAIDTGLITRTIVLTAAAGAPTTTSGCAPATYRELGTNDVDIWYLAFDKDTKEYAFWNFKMPDSYDGGTLTAVFEWTTAGSSGDVIWGIQGIAYADDDALDTAYGSAQEVADSFLAADDVHISPVTSAITLAGSPAGGQKVIIRVYRDAADGSDTLDADAQLMNITLEYSAYTISD